MITMAIAHRLGGRLVDDDHVPGTITGLVFDPTDTVTGRNMFIQHMPAAPDIAVAVMATGGFQQPTLDPSDLPTVQILVRGVDPEAVNDMAMAIYADLTCLDRATLDAGGTHETYVHGCTALQSAPIPIGLDENRRHESSLNFALSTHNPTDHRTAA